MIKKLFAYLKNAEIDTYLPARKDGKCTSPYAVINEEKSEPGLTGRCLYTYFTVTVVAPADNYSALDQTVSKVRSALKGTQFRFDGSESAEVNENIQGYCRVLNYRVIKPMGCKN